MTLSPNSGLFSGLFVSASEVLVLFVLSWFALKIMGRGFLAVVTSGMWFINFVKVGWDLIGKVIFEGWSFGEIIGTEEEGGDGEMCERESAISEKRRKFLACTVMIEKKKKNELYAIFSIKNPCV